MLGGMATPTTQAPFNRPALAGWLALAACAAVLHAPPALALVAGALAAWLLGNPVREQTNHWSGQLLKASVVLLGFGLQLGVVWTVGRRSAGVAVATISATLAAGWLLGRWLRLEKKLSLLVSAGTAICGGSAIAALAPAIGAGVAETGVALAVVFLLNGVALVVFPWLGHWAGMGPETYGLFCALAVHDTSSVVGAAASMGAPALAVATTVKLTRALWIAPLAWGAARAHGQPGRFPVPWFLLGFVAASAVVTVWPALAGLAGLGKAGLSAALVLVGAGFGREHWHQLRGAALVQGVLLWALVCAGVGLALLAGWIAL